MNENNLDIPKITAEINMNDNDGPSIYVSFHENNYKICHLTIHLCPTSWYSETKGPLHITNNTYYRATRRIRVNHRKNGSIRLKLGTTYKVDDTGMKANKYCNYVIKVLNTYLKPNSEYYLGKDKINNHNKLKNIIKQTNNALSMLGRTSKTRKMRRSKLN